MLLDATNRSYELVLTAAQTTTAMSVSVDYVDETTTALPAAGIVASLSNGATPVTILASPAASTRRVVRNLTVFNDDTAAKIVVISLNVATVLYKVVSATLQVDEMLGYTDTNGWYVQNASGERKTSGIVFGSALPLMNGTAATGTATPPSREDHVHPSDTSRMAVATYDSDGDGFVDDAEAISIAVRNVTGVAMTKGQAVYVSGATGQTATVALAKADVEATSANTIGILLADLANNANGNAVLIGRLEGFDTSAFADGALLYLSPTTAGAMTSTKPAAPDQLVFLGYVTYSHATQGKIAVKIDNGFEIEELHNVSITAVADKNALQYEAATSLWKNVSEREAVANKATSFATANDTLYPSVLAVKTYADALVVGLLDDRGSYDASVNTFPASGGSGTAGAVLKGDLWYISVAGTLGGVAVAIGDSVRALVDTPGQTATNWSILESNIGYVPENSANKDVSAGYVGKTLEKINFWNAARTFMSFFTNAATAARTYTFPDKDGTVAMTNDKLSVFAATTSAELAGVLSDETGTGAAVFATSPTLVTPALGNPTSGVTDNLTTTTSAAAIVDTDFVDSNLAAGGKRKVLWTAVKTYLATTFAALGGSATQAFSTSTAAAESNTTIAASTAFVNSAIANLNLNSAVHMNPSTITTDTVIPSFYNAYSAGPLTIGEGVSVTVNDDANWTIV
jgi:hypothetical protein